MMKSGSIFLVSAIALLAGFGFAISGHGHMTGSFTNCPAETFQGASCPEGGFSSFSFHLEALHGFSGAIVASILYTLALLALSFFVAGVAPRHAHRPRVAFKTEGFYSITQRLHDWLELHEAGSSH